MSIKKSLKLNSFVAFWELLLPEERILTDLLRQIILQNIPASYTEKFSYNVPYYYGKRRCCFIWPASIPNGGFKLGVMLGFCNGYKLKDTNHYLEHGTNKKVFYKIFTSAEEINIPEIVTLLQEAIRIDLQYI